jgi:glycosyltransferase involved in cell wall biosynthesis
MSPLVSVISPTWQRHEWLFDRCIASVKAQEYSPIEHVIVCDGPDPVLAELIGQMEMTAGYSLIFEQMPPNPDPRWGTRARLRGLELATADLIAYLDDDDSYRPDHCSQLVRALERHPEVGFAYTQMASHGGVIDGAALAVIGSGDLGPCAIGTPMIMHRRELLEISTWGPPDAMEDWRLVDRWVERGIKSEFVPWVTIDVWPSAYR